MKKFLAKIKSKTEANNQKLKIELANKKLEILKSRNTVFELSRKQVKTQYRDSSLGFLWSVLNPLLNTLVMWLIFTQFLERPDPYFLVYLLTGNILFTALKNSTVQSLHSFLSNRGLLLRTKIKPSVFPTSYVLSSLINLGFSLLALIPFMIVLSVNQGINLFSYQLLFILLMLPAFLAFELGIALFLSVIYVYFRDMKHIYDVFLTLWHYITPIFYKPTDKMNSTAMVIIKLNPMYYFVTYFRECVYMGAASVDTAGNVLSSSYLPSWSTLGFCYLCGAISIIIGTIVFKSLKTKIIMKV